MIKTRFAPSPTGYLHVGGLRTALYAYLIAKQNNGKFILRIEDTDRERYVADGTLNILKSLYWANLIPDEGVKLDCENSSNCLLFQEGENGPYIQSERLAIYHKYAEDLIKEEKAYYCFCTPERLQELRLLQQEKGLPSKYDRKCCAVSQAEAKEKIKNGKKYVIRMKMPEQGETSFHDLIKGDVSFKNELIDDQVILKSDGFPTYHLAVVVDDHLMGVTHIIRGDEWLSSVPKHIQLYNYFGWEVPKMAHLPLLLNPDKSKLSKRQGDVAVEDYINKGYLPEALLNFVAFLGWNPGTEKELYTTDELIKDFKLEKVAKSSGAVFNLQKLDWYNQQYIKKLSGKELIQKSKKWILQSNLLTEKDLEDKNKMSWLEKVVNLEKERITTLSELPEAVQFIFQLPDYDHQLLIWKKSTAQEVKEILPDLAEYMNNLSVQDWNKQNLEKEIVDWIKQKNLSVGSVLWPLRVSLSGQQNSPGPYEIADVLGKEETISRIKVAIGKLS